MNGSVKIGRIFGIPIYLHITFLLILPLFAWIFSVQKGEVLGIPIGFGNLETSDVVRYAFGTGAAVIFFVTVVAHELSHSYLAMRYGVRIKSITLMLFGGMASLEEVPKEPRREWRMSFAGPLSSLLIGGASYGSMLVVALIPSDSVLVEGVVILLGLIAFYNVLLALFNLIPAFPMDGGRLLRSYYASRMSYLDATRKAARVGRYFAIGMGITGIFINFWLILIAFFVYIGASEEERATIISESLSGMKVRQLMTAKVEVVHPNVSAQQLLDMMLTTRHMGFPVVDTSLVGIVTLSDVQKVPKEQLPLTPVRSIMTSPVVTVDPEMDAAKALRLMTGKSIGRLIVVEGGSIVGIVTKKDFLQAVNVISSRPQWGYQYPSPQEQSAPQQQPPTYYYYPPPPPQPPNQF